MRTVILGEFAFGKLRVFIVVEMIGDWSTMQSLDQIAEEELVIYYTITVSYIDRGGQP